MRKRMVSLSFVLLVFAFAVPGPGGPPREAAFVVGQSTYVAGGRVGRADGVPFVEGGRVFVPVRYLAYALGISEGDIKWAGDSGAVSLKLGRTLL